MLPYYRLLNERRCGTTLLWLDVCRRGGNVTARRIHAIFRVHVTGPHAAASIAAVAVCVRRGATRMVAGGRATKFPHAASTRYQGRMVLRTRSAVPPWPVPEASSFENRRSFVSPREKIEIKFELRRNNILMYTYLGKTILKQYDRNHFLKNDKIKLRILVKPFFRYVPMLWRRIAINRVHISNMLLVANWILDISTIKIINNIIWYTGTRSI